MAVVSNPRRAATFAAAATSASAGASGSAIRASTKSVTPSLLRSWKTRPGLKKSATPNGASGVWARRSATASGAIRAMADNASSRRVGTPLNVSKSLDSGVAASVEPPGFSDAGPEPRRRTKQKGTASLRCPSALLIWLPQHSRRPAVIRPAAATRASGVPAKFSGKSHHSREIPGQTANDFVVALTVLSNSAAADPFAPPATDSWCHAARGAAPSPATGSQASDRSTRCQSHWPDRRCRCTCTRPVRPGSPRRTRGRTPGGYSIAGNCRPTAWAPPIGRTSGIRVGRRQRHRRFRLRSRESACPESAAFGGEGRGSCRRAIVSGCPGRKPVCCDARTHPRGTFQEKNRARLDGRAVRGWALPAVRSERTPRQGSRSAIRSRYWP